MRLLIPASNDSSSPISEIHVVADTAGVRIEHGSLDFVLTQVDETQLVEALLDRRRARGPGAVRPAVGNGEPCGRHFAAPSVHAARGGRVIDHTCSVHGPHTGHRCGCGAIVATS